MMARKELRAAVIQYTQRCIAGWGDAGLQKKIARHAADTVEKAVMESFEDLEKLSQRSSVYVVREMARAYAGKFAQLLEADIEAAAQRHLLATLGPRVQALEDAAKGAATP